MKPFPIIFPNPKKTLDDQAQQRGVIVKKKVGE